MSEDSFHVFIQSGQHTSESNTALFAYRGAEMKVRHSAEELIHLQHKTVTLQNQTAELSNTS